MFKSESPVRMASSYTSVFSTLIGELKISFYLFTFFIFLHLFIFGTVDTVFFYISESEIYNFFNNIIFLYFRIFNLKYNIFYFKLYNLKYNFSKYIFIFFEL